MANSFSIKASKLLTILSIIFCLTINNSLADSKDYFFENIAAKSEGKSPQEARELATNKANREAFLTLLGRLKISKTIADNATDEEIANMIGSKQIRSEKFAGNSYDAKLNIVFSKDFVDYFLKEKSIETDSKKFIETFLVIPAEVKNSKIFLWEEDNFWIQEIRNLTNKEKTLILPSPDITNITYINSKNIISSNYDTIEPVISRYNASGAYILIFDYDVNNKKVTINVKNIKKFQEKLLRLTFSNIENLEYNDLLNKVADKTINFIKNYEKQKNKNPNHAKIMIRIEGLSEWVTTQKRLAKSSHIDSFEVISLSKDYAIIMAKYASKEIDIETIFAQIGFSLKEDYNNNSFITNAK